MFTKEGLSAIKELKNNTIMNIMTEAQLTAYSKHLNTFIDSFPALADKMRQAIDVRSFNMLATNLGEAADMLENITATAMAKDARSKSNELKGGGANAIDHDETEAFVEKLILNASTLSIEIQMSAHKKAAPAATTAAAKPAPKRSVPQIFTAGTGGTPVSDEPPDPTYEKGASGAPKIFSAGETHSGGILAVDNAIMFLNTLKKLLKDSPYTVHCVDSGSQAMEYLQTNRPSLFLLDVEMPGMDGYQLAQQIKAAGHTAPILFVTANSSRNYVERAISVGAVGLLMKPLRQNQLLDKIKEFI
jgi:CheY-like chemotaxis protein